MAEAVAAAHTETEAASNRQAKTSRVAAEAEAIMDQAELSVSIRETPNMEVLAAVASVAREAPVTSERAVMALTDVVAVVLTSEMVQVELMAMASGTAPAEVLVAAVLVAPA